MMQYPLFNCLNIKPMSPVRRRLNEGEHIVLLTIKTQLSYVAKCSTFVAIIK